MQRTTKAEQQRIRREVDRIPHSLLRSWSEVRTALIELAMAGVEMNVYQHGLYEWVVWLRPAAGWAPHACRVEAQLCDAHERDVGATSGERAGGVMARVVRFQRTTVEFADMVVPADADAETWQDANADVVACELNNCISDVTFEVVDEWEDTELDDPDSGEGEDA